MIKNKQTTKTNTMSKLILALKLYYNTFILFFLRHTKLFHYKYKRFYIKAKYFIRGPLFKAYSYILFISFSSLIGYQIYNRLIRERLPLDLNDPVNNVQLGIYSYILFINVCLFLMLLIQKIKEIWGNPEHIGYFTTFSIKVEKIFLEKFFLPVSKTYLELIYSTIPMHYERFLIAIFIFFNNFSEKVKVTYFYAMLILPKITVLICFLIDLFIFNCFYYFYKVLWLLLLPLLLRFLYYVFRYLDMDAPERIMDEMNTSPEAPGPLTDKQIENIVVHTEKNLRPFMEAKFKEQKQIMASAWYIQLYYKVKSDVILFKYNITVKKTSAEQYTYNIRTYCILHALTPTIILFDSIKSKTYFYLNLVIRTGYIIGWLVVILKQLT